MKKFRPNQAGTTAETFDIARRITLDSTAISVPWTWTFPASPGAPGLVLQTDGTGNLSWAAVGAAADSTVPYFIPAGVTYTVNQYKQALFTTTIDVEGTLEIDGLLIEVS